MYRIDDATAATSLPAPEAAGTEGYYTEGSPVAGTPATNVRASWLNMIQEELRAVVVAGGLTPSKTAYTQVRDAIKRIGQNTIILVDTGAANAYTAVNPTPLVAGTWVDGVIQAVKIAHANTGASTYAPDGLAAIPIYGLGLQPLQGGELALNGTALLMHATIAGVNGGNPICVLMECAGGAQQVASATQSQHAVQLGQVTSTSSPLQLTTQPATQGNQAIPLSQVQSLLTNMLVVTSSQGVTVPANVTKMKYRAVGPGAGAGGSNATNSAAGGAGSGSYSEGVLAVTPGATLTVTIGAPGAQGTTGNGNAGGTTTITGTGISVSVFSGGPSLGASAGVPVGAGGVGGSVSVTSGANVLSALNEPGAPGQSAFYGSGSGYFSGNGANSVFGGPLPGGGGYPGAGAGAHGAGGSGGANNNFGGNGSPSAVIFEW
ncbi:hypothetical protein [Burkholderia ubonensis]|uniref:glycine-rich domain-containing protein n=1 Tax=Burkholderia ubonensis TaxID=101571 RepID=UPI000AF0F7F7|nr:hypothetical protein [Burkholderia ubonensis]